MLYLNYNWLKIYNSIDIKREYSETQNNLNCKLSGGWKVSLIHYVISFSIHILEKWHLYSHFVTTFWQFYLSYTHYIFIFHFLFSLSIVFDQWKERKKKLSHKLSKMSCSNITTPTYITVTSTVHSQKWSVPVLFLPNFINNRSFFM